MTNPETIFEQEGWLQNKQLTEEGLTALAHILSFLPPMHAGVKWGPVFVPLLSKCVPASAELVIVEDGKVLLTHRKDEYFDGWHFPGSYIGPQEDFSAAATRAAKAELECEIEVVRYLTSYLNSDNPRFVDLGNLILCRPKTTPKNGTWFTEPPTDLIPVHKKYWETVVEVL